MLSEQQKAIEEATNSSLLRIQTASERKKNIVHIFLSAMKHSVTFDFSNIFFSHILSSRRQRNRESRSTTVETYHFSFSLILVYHSLLKPRIATDDNAEEQPNGLLDRPLTVGGNNLHATDSDSESRYTSLLYVTRAQMLFMPPQRSI
jgi:hypothetical protein